ncbi:DUF1493 family protein [Erwinia psidii]|uniref:DUF1493 family protein n=1 Tax=Erwinia psidii TaxID=69224 RepID=UPI001F307040|nr:DUF1493 family protein [Erwinia psidii]
MTDTANAVGEFVRREQPRVTTFLLKKIEINDGDILQELYEADDIAEMSEKSFQECNVQPAGFTLDDYFPWKMSSFFTSSCQQGQKAADY